MCLFPRHPVQSARPTGVTSFTTFNGCAPSLKLKFRCNDDDNDDADIRLRVLCKIPELSSKLFHHHHHSSPIPNNKINTPADECRSFFFIETERLSQLSLCNENILYESIIFAYCLERLDKYVKVREATCLYDIG